MGKTGLRIIGSSTHSLNEREMLDFYATPPEAVEGLLKHEKFSKLIWEPACGMGHICEVLKKHGYDVVPSDLVDRGYFGTVPLDFLFHLREGDFEGDIITNPPFRAAQDFIERALQVVEPGHKVAMLLRLNFLEGQNRKEFFRMYPPKTIYVSSSRIQCAINGDFEGMKSKGGSTIAYAWFVYEKGWKGETILKWFN